MPFWLPTVTLDDFKAVLQIKHQIVDVLLGGEGVFHISRRGAQDKAATLAACRDALVDEARDVYKIVALSARGLISGSSNPREQVDSNFMANADYLFDVAASDTALELPNKSG